MVNSALSTVELKEHLARQPKQLPVSCLYDKRGSDLYEEITALPEYYPFNEELDLLKAKADEIIAHIPSGSIILELGCGSAAKTGTILNAIAHRDGPELLQFVGIDVSQQALDLASASLLEHCPQLLSKHVDLICADYLAGLTEARLRYPDAHLCAMWLGSSVGNLSPDEALAFFEQISTISGPKMQVLLCTDLWKDEKVLHSAYHDSQGVTEAFIKNGMVHALRTLGVPGASSLVQRWRYDVRVNQKLQQVEMWLHATSAAVNGQLLVDDGDSILMEVSRKFTMANIRSLAFRSGWYVQQAWSSGKYGIHMLLPNLEAVQRCHADTDAFFAAVPDWTLTPIDVRHPFVFYYGHIAAFATIKAFPEDTPSSRENMFSRGIDVDLADPSKCCNSHPDIPSEWPSPKETKAFVQELRHKYVVGIKSGIVKPRAVWLMLEHERMHLETLCYMRAQARKKSFDCQAVASANGFHSSGHVDSSSYEAYGNSMVAVKGRDVILGVDTDFAADVVWDNEAPRTNPAPVASFKVASKPCSIGDFHRFVVKEQGYSSPEWWDAVDWDILQKQKQVMPATWSLADNDDPDGDSLFIHTPEGSFHWREVCHEPVWLSLAEAQAYAKSRGFRIMSEPEYHCILADPAASKRVEHLRDQGWEWTSTEFAPFPGFKPTPEYPAYSADFFDGKHYVLKGSAPCTHPALVRDSFRNFYQKQYPYVFAKFRLCSS